MVIDRDDLLLARQAIVTCVGISITLLAVEVASSRGSIGHREVTIYTNRKEVDGEPLTV